MSRAVVRAITVTITTTERGSLINFRPNGMMIKNTLHNIHNMIEMKRNFN